LISEQSESVRDHGAVQYTPFVPAPTKGEIMTEVAKSRLSRPPRQRAVALFVASAGALFWLYTFFGIAQVPGGDGSGFKWIAVIPLGLVFLILTLPALILALIDRWLWLSLILGCIGLAAFAYLWNELLGEFYH
jgi:hypothetical protein